MNKSVLTCAIAAILNLDSMPAGAVTITSWKLGDVMSGGNSDTVSLGPDAFMSDMTLWSPPSGAGPGQFGASNEMCGSNACTAIAINGSAIGTNIFTTGFNFGGVGVWSPFLDAGGILADITGSTLTFSVLNFSGLFSSTSIDASPNILVNCTGQAGCGTSATMGYEARVAQVDSATWAVRVRYVNTLYQPGGFANGFQANWRLEGMMSSTANQVPVPATAYLLSSGLVGLAAIARRRLKSKSRKG